VSEIVNLRLARKRAAKEARDREAAENRARHGLSKAERARRKTETKRLRMTVDGAKRDDPSES
jgi:hypothetical protein